MPGAREPLRLLSWPCLRRPELSRRNLLRLFLEPLPILIAFKCASGFKEALMLIDRYAAIRLSTSCARLNGTTGAPTLSRLRPDVR